MQIAAIADNLKFNPEKMQKNNLFETPRFFCDLYCFEPGQEQKTHSHDGADKVYYVLEGEGDFLVGQEVATLTAGQAVLAPSETEHGVVNRSGKRLVVLVFMAPNPNAQ